MKQPSFTQLSSASLDHERGVAFVHCSACHSHHKPQQHVLYHHGAPFILHKKSAYWLICCQTGSPYGWFPFILCESVRLALEV